MALTEFRQRSSVDIYCGAQVAVPQYRLDRLIVYTKLMLCGCEPAPEPVPTMLQYSRAFQCSDNPRPARLSRLRGFPFPA